MFYAIICDNQCNDHFDGADGQPVNYGFYSFPSVAALHAATAEAYDDGGNGMRVSRRHVETYLGRRFVVHEDGLCERVPYGATEYELIMQRKQQQEWWAQEREMEEAVYA